MSVKQRKPIPKRRRGKPRRVSVPRDPKYKAFLRAEGWCAVCYERPVEVAHGPVNGTGSKGSDLEAIPLCPKHHRIMHRYGNWHHFCRVYSMDRTAEVAFWNLRYTLAVAPPKKETNGKR